MNVAEPPVVDPDVLWRSWGDLEPGERVLCLRSRTARDLGLAGMRYLAARQPGYVGWCASLDSHRDGDPPAVTDAEVIAAWRWAQREGLSVIAPQVGCTPEELRLHVGLHFTREPE